MIGSSIALLPLLMTAAVGHSTDDCGDKLLCVVDVPTDSGMACEVRNQSAAPITFTLKVDSRYHQGSRDLVVTKTIDSGNSLQAFTFEPRGKGRNGRYCFHYRSTIGRIDAQHDDEHLYRLPYASGKSYRVLQGFGSRFSHTGREQYAVDFNMSEGTPVMAARGGIVADYEESNTIGCWEDDCGKYANYIVIAHDDGTTGEYYHLQKDGALVELGERVEEGQHIGYSGNTGHTTMPHLHFGVYRPQSWGSYQSIEVRFISADGIIDRPRRGGRYQAISVKNANSKYETLPSVYEFSNKDSKL